MQACIRTYAEDCLAHIADLRLQSVNYPSLDRCPLEFQPSLP